VGVIVLPYIPDGLVRISLWPSELSRPRHQPFRRERRPSIFHWHTRLFCIYTSTQKVNRLSTTSL